MPKKIAFCADGTWNHPHSPVLVETNDTNVYKLYKLLAVTSSQITFYDDGVGADGTPIDRLSGGAFGVGLFQKVKDGYTAIAHVYEAGDEVFIFGFSRGAYTARSIAGMIAVCGLPTRNFDPSMVETAFDAYRNRDQRAALPAKLAAFGMDAASITMVGVWDTVGALGIPGALFGLPDPLFGFLDTGLNPKVKNAYHAMAIDERRSEFHPTLWTSAAAPGQVVSQVWFPGVHCDVGGGYPEAGLSSISLSWMLKQALALGIEVVHPAADQYPSPMPQKFALDQIHESWNLLWGFPRRRTVDAAMPLASDVEVRVDAEDGYAPPNLNYDASGKLTGYNFEPVV